DRVCAVLAQRSIARRVAGGIGETDHGNYPASLLLFRQAFHPGSGFVDRRLSLGRKNSTVRGEKNGDGFDRIKIIEAVDAVVGVVGGVLGLLGIFLSFRCLGSRRVGSSLSLSQLSRQTLLLFLLRF